MKDLATTVRPASGDRLLLLRTFRDVVEAGSLSGAAEREGISQPTASRRLRALEEELGTRLLSRTTHALRLTTDGERCYARACALLRDWELLEEELAGDAEPRGRLRVVVPHAFGQEALIGPLVAYMQRFPEVQVDWLLRDALPDFVGEGIDCAIHLGEVRDAGLVVRKLIDVVREAFVAPSLLEGRVVRVPGDLEAFPWVALLGYYRDSIEFRQVGGKRARVSFRPRLATDNIYALRSAAIRGMGVCVGSSWLLSDAVAQGSLVPLLPGWRASPMPVHLVYPYAPHLPTRLRRFSELMRALVPKALEDSELPARSGAYLSHDA